MRMSKFKVQTSVGKIVNSVFWKSKGILSANFVKRSASINSEQCVQTLTKLKWQIQKFQPKRKVNQILVHLIVLIYHLYLQIFTPLKDTLWVFCFADYDKLKCNMLQKMKETRWKNKLNFLQDVPMEYVNFITIVNYSFWEKMGSITFVLPLI